MPRPIRNPLTGPIQPQLKLRLERELGLLQPNQDDLSDIFTHVSMQDSKLHLDSFDLSDLFSGISLQEDSASQVDTSTDEGSNVLATQTRERESYQRALDSFQCRNAIYMWRERVLRAFTDPAQITPGSFPWPPKIFDCKSHASSEPCDCNIVAAFNILRDIGSPFYDFGSERLMWNPLRFNGCHSDVKPLIKRMSLRIFVLLAKMHRETQAEAATSKRKVLDEPKTPTTPTTPTAKRHKL